MTARRHALIIATQSREMIRLDRLEPVAAELASVLLDPDHGDCRPGLPEGAQLVGELSQAEIERAVRRAIDYAAENAATLILAFLGHGFRPGAYPTLYLMAAESREDMVHTAVNIPALLAAAVDRPNLEGVIALVDTCHAGGAIPSMDAVAAGVRNGRTALEVLMACGSAQIAVDFQLTTTLCALLTEGSGDASTIKLGDLTPELVRRVTGQVPTHQGFNGEGRHLWISRNRRATSPEQGLGVFGFGRYREFVREALPDLSGPPAVHEAINLLRERRESAQAQKFRTVQITVELLRSPLLRDLVTTARLLLAAGIELPGHLFAAGQIDAEVVAYLVLNPSLDEDSGHGRLLRFVLRLVHECGADLQDWYLKQWIDRMGIAPARVNDVWEALNRSPERIRLVVSLHAGLTGDWPEVISACLQLDGEDLYNRQYPCAPTADGVNTAIVDAVFDADEAAEARGLERCRRVDLAAPAGLLLHWRPEEIEDVSRLGADHDFVLHWSERLKQSRQMRRALRLLHERPAGSPRFSRLERGDLSDLAALAARLRDHSLSSAVVLGCRPDDAEDLLMLLLAYTPYVIWPADPGGDCPSPAELDDTWHTLPIGFSEAYRNRWSGQASGEGIGGLRAVWDDEHWLGFCREMQSQPEQKGAA